MTPKRYEALRRGLNAAARTVVDAVPVQEAWTLHQILQELTRQGRRVDVPVARACLGTGISVGLVREHPVGQYQRIEVRASATQAANDDEDEDDTPMTPKAAPPPKTPFEKLAEVAVDLRTLASRIENIALEFEELSQRANTDTAKLRQLQNLLRELQT